MTTTTTHTAISSVITAAEGLIAKAGELQLIGKSGTQYAVLRIKKLYTRQNIIVALEHDLREAHAPNADPDGDGVEVIAGARTVSRALERLDEVYERVNDGEPLVVVKNGRRPVLALELVMDGPSREVWLSWDEEKRAAWKAAQIEWLKRYFPAQAILVSVVHLDESRVHNTAVVVPIAQRPTPQALRYERLRGGDGSSLPQPWTLSAKTFVGAKKYAFRERQTEYAEAMAPFGLKRGRFVEETKAYNIPNKIYRARAAELVEGMQLVLGEMRDIVVEHDRLNDDLDKSRREAERLKDAMTASLRSEHEALELLRQTTEADLERQIAEAKAKLKKEAEAVAALRSEAAREREAAREAEAKADALVAVADRTAAENNAAARQNLIDSQRNLEERGRLGLLAERLERGQRDLTERQAAFAAERNEAAKVLAKAADVMAREAHVDAKEGEVKRRIAGFNTQLQANKAEREALAREKVAVAEAKAMAEAATVRADAKAAAAERARRLAVAQEDRARAREKAFESAIGKVPYIHQQTVKRMASVQAGITIQ